MWPTWAAIQVSGDWTQEAWNLPFPTWGQGFILT